jgi:hypothetical protein
MGCASYYSKMETNRRTTTASPPGLSQTNLISRPHTFPGQSKSSPFLDNPNSPFHPVIDREETVLASENLNSPSKP